MQASRINIQISGGTIGRNKALQLMEREMKVEKTLYIFENKK